VIYVDETSVNNWIATGKTWMPKGCTLTQIKHKTKAKNHSIVGAISKEQGLIALRIFPHTFKKRNFLEFLDTIADATDNSTKERRVLILDNHAIHHGIGV